MVYDIFREAVLSRAQVVCRYKGLHREVCPHTLGRKRGKPHVLTWQFAGQTSQGVLPAGGEWRCLDLNHVTDAVLRKGEWHTGGRHTKPQTCVDQIDVEVAF